MNVPEFGFTALFFQLCSAFPAFRDSQSEPLMECNMKALFVTWDRNNHGSFRIISYLLNKIQCTFRPCIDIVPLEFDLT